MKTFLFSNAFSVSLVVIMASLEPGGRSFPPLLETYYAKVSFI